ncbi:hypothetical protein OH693_24055 [Escherichia coli]|nr:hypothetical protein [Escherichia coli]
MGSALLSTEMALERFLKSKEVQFICSPPL